MEVVNISPKIYKNEKAILELELKEILISI